jgi:arylsulfatase A-like enzyme
MLEDCMRRVLATAAVGAFVTGMALVAPSADGSVGAVEATPSQPNIIFVLTDDQRIDTYQTMPTVRNQLRGRGGNYRAIIPPSICCPSRVSLLTGDLAHTTGVYTNSLDYGGWPTFYDSGYEDQTVAVALHDAGYRTGFMGKYLNYWNQAPDGYVPPGWDVFRGFWRDRGQGGGIYYNYELRGTGKPEVFGHERSDYSATVLQRKAVRFIENTPADTPYFVFINPTNPHAPYTPAPGDSGSWTPKTPYDNPGVNEVDMSDKPAHMRGLSKVPRSDINAAQIGTGESLRSVDRIVRAAMNADDMENTLVIYMSDNGVMWGDHRVQYKYRPYRFATEVPLFMRWDGVIEPGTKGLVANIDIAPTLLQVAGVPGALDTEGISALPAATRQSVLLEGVNRGRPAYCGIRSQRYLFVEHATGERELYDYQTDPYELHNLANRDAYVSLVESMRQQAVDECVPTPPNFSWQG